MISYDDLTGEETSAPPVPEDPTPLQREWWEQGAVTVKDLMPDRLMDAYCTAWHRENLCDAPETEATAYRQVPELADLCCYGPLGDILEELIGEPCGVHLNLVGWVSTERDWHQDAYLNPPEVGSWYAAVWFALDRIHSDAGPFEWVPGSHRWPLLDQAKVRAQIPAELRDDPMWPRYSEAVLTPAIKRRMFVQGARTRRFLGEKGDVLIWHARTIHRGSPPIMPGLERRAVIAHYSGVNHRVDMPAAMQHSDGGWMFPL